MAFATNEGNANFQSRFRPVTAFMIVLIFLSGTDIYAIITGSGANTGMLRFLTLVPIFAIASYNIGHIVRGLFVAPELAFLYIFVIMSALWSIDQSITIKHLIPLLATSSLAIIAASMLSMRSLLVMFGHVSALIMYGSLVAVLLFSSARGSPPWDNVWNGVFSHKNALGAASVTAILVAIPAAMYSTGFKRLYFSLTVAIGIYLVVVTQSRSAQLIGFLSVFSLAIGFAVRRNTMLWSVLNIAAILLFSGAIFVMISTGAIDPLFDILNRKPTLSGRIPLWQIVWPEIEKEFWFGYGYSAFWDEQSTRVLKIAGNPALRFSPYYSHNGLLETFLNSGFVGVVLFVIFIVRTTWDAFICQRFAEDRRLLVAAFVLFLTFLMLNVTESSILARTEVSWIIFVAVCVKIRFVAKALRKKQKLIAPKPEPLFAPVR